MKTDELKKVSNKLEDYVDRNFKLDEISSEYVNLFNIKDFRDYQKKAIAIFSLLSSENYSERFEVYLQGAGLDLSEQSHYAFQMATGSGKTLLMATNMIQLYEKRDINKFIITAPKGVIFDKTKRNFFDEKSPDYLFNSKQNDYNFVEVEDLREFKKIEEQRTVSEADTIYIYVSTIQKLNTDSKVAKENMWTWEEFEDLEICLLGDEAHYYSGETRGGNRTDTIESYEETIEKFKNLNNRNIVLEYSATFGFQNEAMREKYKDKLIFDYNLHKFYQAGYCKRPMTLTTMNWRESIQDKSFLKKYLIYSILVNEFKQYLIEEKLSKEIKPFVLAKFPKLEDSEALMEAIKELHHQISNGENPEVLAEVKKEIDENDESLLLNHMKRENFLEQNFGDLVLDFLGERLKKKKKSDMEFSRIMRYDTDTKNEEKRRLLETIDDFQNPIKLLISVEMVSEGWDVDNLFTLAVFEKGSREGISIRQLLGRGLRINNEVFDSERRQYEDVEPVLSQLENLHILCNKQNVLVRISERVKKELGEKNVDGLEDRVVLKLKDQYQGKKIYCNDLEKEKIESRISIDELRDFLDVSEDYANRYKNMKLVESGGGSLRFKFLRPILRKLVEQDFWEFEEVDEEVDLQYRVDSGDDEDLWGDAVFEYFEDEISIEFLNYIDYSTVGELRNFVEDLQVIVDYSADEDILEDGELPRGDRKALFKRVVDYAINLIEEKKIYEKTRVEGEEELGEVFRAVSRTSRDNFCELSGENSHIYENGFFGNDLEKAMGEVLGEFCEETEGAFWVRNEVQYSVFIEKENDFIRFKPDFLLFTPSPDGRFKQVLVETKGEHIKKFHNNPQKEEFLRSLDKDFDGENIENVSGFYFISDRTPSKAEIKEKLLEALQ